MRAMELVAVIAALVAVAVIVVIRWPAFTRDRRGPALTLSVTALVAFACAGIAQGADAPAPWPLVGLLIGMVLYVVAEYLAGRQRSSAPNLESRARRRDDLT
jgi:hypothetical protein